MVVLFQSFTMSALPQGPSAGLVVTFFNVVGFRAARIIVVDLRAETRGMKWLDLHVNRLLSVTYRLQIVRVRRIGLM